MMFCKKCSTEFEGGNFCPECCNRVVSNNSRFLYILFAVVVIGFSILFGIYGDNQFFGYSLIDLYTIGLVILGIIWVVWIFNKKRPKISISLIKDDFTNLIGNIRGIGELPDYYKNIVLTGYLSIMLFFISIFLNIIANVLYGGLNENQEAGALAVITLLVGIILYFYSWIRMVMILRKINGKNSLRYHFNVIWGFFIIFIFFNIILSQFKII